MRRHLVSSSRAQRTVSRLGTCSPGCGVGNDLVVAYERPRVVDHVLEGGFGLLDAFEGLEECGIFHLLGYVHLSALGVVLAAVVRPW